MNLPTIYGKRNRVSFKGATYHLSTRCNNQNYLIKDNEDFEKYISILKKCKEKYGFLLHDYSPVNNHSHLIIRLGKMVNISKVMQSINRQYARWNNKKYNRKGHFWEERFYCTLMEDDLQLLTAMMYVDLNPVKAGLCNYPDNWRFSGAAHYLKGAKNNLIDTPDVYLTLGNNAASRQNTYAKILELYFNRLKKTNK